MAAEAHLLLIGNRLPREEEHAVAAPGALDGFHGGPVERSGQTDPGDFSPDQWMQLPEANGQFRTPREALPQTDKQ